MSVKIDTTELDKLLRTIPINRDKIVKKSAFSIQATSQQTTAYKDVTGALRSNVETVKKGDGWSVEYYQEYAPYVELGTHNLDGSDRMAARPFLTPAVEMERAKLEKALSTELIK